MSVRPYGTIWFPLDRFLSSVDILLFFENVSHEFKFR